MNERIGDENQIDSNDDDIDYESKKYYGIMIPLSECLGFIRIVNKEANTTIQSYIRDSKKKNGKKNDDFLSKLTDDDLFELISIGMNNDNNNTNKINDYEFSMNYLERWYKSILNSFNSSKVKKIELTELMLLSPNSDNVFPDTTKDKKNNKVTKTNNNNSKKRKGSKKIQYELFSENSIIDLYRKREQEKALQQQHENLSNTESSETSGSKNEKEKNEKLKKKKTVKEIILNLKSLIFDVLYDEKQTIEDFGHTIDTIHKILYGKAKEDDPKNGTESESNTSSNNLELDKPQNENSKQEMQNLYLKTLESSIILTPGQIDNKYKNFVNYINSLTTTATVTINNDTQNDQEEDMPPPPPTQKSDYFNEGIIDDAEEKRIKEWKWKNEKEMEKIEEKVTKMKIEEVQIQVIILLEYLRLNEMYHIPFPEKLLNSESPLPPTLPHHKKKDNKKSKKPSDLKIVKNILETLMDKLCIWMTLDQIPMFDSTMNTPDNELSDDKITDFVNRILRNM